ncbi:ABC transporter ATP-binding protein [Parabacteroides pacaensis]|uniref:ABC transporter ATP-binding protein n=1 Tax=Parabacteroides pacaensis TaxID=2086575 RepID=UPI000D0EE587|nr:ABC transporter ATP-binding protein [Parabacteroides pacaensis]
MEERIPTIYSRNLSIGYRLKGGKKKIIHTDMSLSLYAGEVTCLLGLNGAGKSTLLKTLGGFLPPLAGDIYLRGEKLSSYTQHEFALQVGVVLTDRTNAGGITVYDLVSLGRYPYTGFFGQLKKKDHQVIQASLQAVGISHKSANYVSELSDGERQKAMIAKVLAQECPVILLDEPTAFLDVTSKIETMVLLRELARKHKKTILLSTHDLEQAIQMADCLWLQSPQRPLLCGAPEDLILAGELGTFFEKGKIRFDLSTGKIHLKETKRPVGITGSPLITYWVSNALQRNGYFPGPVQPGQMAINCVSSHELEIIHTSGSKKTVGSIEALMNYIKNLPDTTY